MKSLEKSAPNTQKKANAKTLRKELLGMFPELTDGQGNYIRMSKREDELRERDRSQTMLRLRGHGEYNVT